MRKSMSGPLSYTAAVLITLATTDCSAGSSLDFRAHADVHSRAGSTKECKQLQMAT
jgi:hypothetical protein